jgi:DNA polymerase-3 subunit epsilon
VVAIGFAVVDVETTGLYPSVDRVIEIAVVRVDSSGRLLDEWATLLDPGRDVGPTSIHGITARDVRGAPRFADIAPELRWRLGGEVLTAHNARFDRTFLAAEFERAGLPMDDCSSAFCTMWGCSRYRLTSSRALAGCCAELGLCHDEPHTALGDARATARLLGVILDRVGVGRLELPAPLAPMNWEGPRVPVRKRTDPPPPRVDPALGALADRIAVPEGVEAAPDAALAYLAVLDHVLEDRCLTGDEVEALAGLARDWGIGASAARALHHAYLGGVWHLARADGVVTQAELDDLSAIAELLGVPVDGGTGDATHVDTPTLPCRAAEFTGLSVCFTGESVCSMGGYMLSREDQQQIAAERGLVVKTCVSSKLGVLVLADVDSQSGKARRAAELGVRRMAEPAFWHALGVAID